MPVSSKTFIISVVTGLQGNAAVQVWRSITGGHDTCRQQDGVSTTSKRPQEQEYEFMGPWIGPLGIMLGLPGVCYALVYTCNAGGEQFP